MRIVPIALLIGCCWQSQAAAAGAAPRDAIALAEKGASFLRQYGKEEMIRRINGKDPAFNHGALYLAMRDLKGITLAHPTTSLIGKNLLDVPDADGKLFRHEMVAIANGAGRGWVDYKFRNPANGRVEAKTTYVLRAGDVALEAGIYKP
jgi:signal transduction histidine kinase